MVTNSRKDISEYCFNIGCIPDEEAAVKIASIILSEIYGSDFDNGLPLEVDFNETAQTWLIKTQLPQYYDGGCKYIILKKRNAEVVAIWAQA